MNPFWSKWWEAYIKLAGPGCVSETPGLMLPSDHGLPAAAPSVRHAPSLPIILSGAIRHGLGVILSSSPCFLHPSHSLDFFCFPVAWILGWDAVRSQSSCPLLAFDYTVLPLIVPPPAMAHLVL